jgi:hypothetical protein
VATYEVLFEIFSLSLLTAARRLVADMKFVLIQESVGWAKSPVREILGGLNPRRSLSCRHSASNFQRGRNLWIYSYKVPRNVYFVNANIFQKLCVEEITRAKYAPE